MADESVEITRQQVDTVAEKMQAWSESLTDQEQLVIGWILQRAMAADQGEVTGYAGPAPTFPGQLGQAAGFGLSSPNAIVIDKGLAAHGLAFGRLGS